MVSLKSYFGIILLLVIISSVGFAYSQTDTIPVWIKGVAGFYAEDKITDSEFIEALEFLIESKIIKVNDPKVKQLEKENMELRQQIKSFESKKFNRSEIKTQDIELRQYITTDKLEYGLGDIIQVSGRFEITEPTKTLDGTLTYQQSLKISITDVENRRMNIDTIVCHYPNDREQTKYPNVESNQFYHSYNNMIEECNIDENGNFTFNLEVKGEHRSGVYEVSSGVSFGYGWELWEYSEPFIIQ